MARKENGWEGENVKYDDMRKATPNQLQPHYVLREYLTTTTTTKRPQKTIDLYEMRVTMHSGVS